MPPSPVWNHPSTIAVGGGLGLVPVALEHDVAARQHLALLVDAELHAQRGRAGRDRAGEPRSVASRSSYSARPRFIVSSGDVSVSP